MGQKSELLEQRLSRAQERITILEAMVEDKTRALFMEQDRLHRSNEQLRDVLEALSSLIIVTNDQLVVEIANAEVEVVLGLPRDQIVGKQLSALIKHAELPFLGDPLTLREHHGFQREILLERPNLETIPLLCTISVLSSEDGVFEGVVFLATDLTSRKELERQLLQSQKLESVGHLAAGIAHEINTPIQYVRDNTLFFRDEFSNLKSLLEQYQEFVAAAVEQSGRAEELKQLSQTLDLPYLLDEIPRALEQTLEGVEAVAKIVRSMRDFSHPGSEDKAKIDLNAAIESTTTVCRNEWKYVADLELELDRSIPPISCFAGEINQVILNLVVNAAHAISDATDTGKKGRGKIKISSKVNDEGVEISISDTGIGIPSEIQSKIFDPFFTTKKLGKGSGQGLAIAFNTIVERHHGILDFSSEVGKGTTFRIGLPFE